MDPYSDRILFTKEPNLMTEFLTSNEYQVGTGYNLFRFSKRIRRMLINKASGLFSWQAQYKEIPYITSEMENIRENISLGVSFVQISCLTTIVKTDSEKFIKQKTQNSLYDYLKDQIPFADEGVHLDYPPAKIEDRMSAIEQRHKALELFLQDYVVNVNILYDKDVDNRFYKYTEIQDDKTI
ncbi:23937_t:CDS:2 [Dentiscutata erythropus]|uniref:23937_t:CDS:1 n=1 Tax=Dentiscutata erythropus TaxID=1348616 RepID=A0A9N9HK06_9GLOM|nr:23937_t:CDS:2 [Dentiscutata erythropus]